MEISIDNTTHKKLDNIVRYQNELLLKAIAKSKYKNNVYHLNKRAFIKSSAKSFDYGILERLGIELEIFSLVLDFSTCLAMWVCLY